MRKKTLFILIFSLTAIHIPKQTLAFSNRAKIVCGTTLAVAGVVGATLFYKRSNECSQALPDFESITHENKQFIENLQSSARRYKLLSLISGAITLAGAGLTTWGIWNLYKNVPTKHEPEQIASEPQDGNPDPEKLGEIQIPGAGNKLSVFIDHTGSYIIKNHEDSNLWRQLHRRICLRGN